MIYLNKLSSIPIENIYYMLCYSWEKLEYIDRNKVGIEESVDIQNLLCRVLVDEVDILIKKGIYRNYNELNESASIIRGKINFRESIKYISTKQCKLNYSYDELDENTLINIILKTTLINLCKLNDLSNENKDKAKRLIKYFNFVDSITLNKKAFKSVSFNKMNYKYKFVINICELIFDNLLINKKENEAQFYNFIEDERKMAYLFENFVRNFYKKELTGSKVYRENISWMFEGSSLEYLPRMQTDISLVYKGKKYIIDTKYYKKSLSENYGSEKLISGNLYQIFSYIKNNENKSEMDKVATGILLYPRVNKTLDLEYKMDNHSINIYTVNLDSKWKYISERLISLIK